jgi:aryl-alcohol dehydrogenase-like predicted oxidoreductase
VKLRSLGRTGLSVSEIAFGCGPTGGLFIRGTPAERRDALACALDLGINYFDTAPGYGNGASESNLGEALAALRATAAVATKVALAWENLGDIPGFIERSVEGSLRRLRRQDVEIVQLHKRISLERAPRAPAGTGAVLTFEDVMDEGGVLDALERLRARGLVKFLGCSAFGGDMNLVRRVVDSGRIDLLTVHYSALNRSAWKEPAGEPGADYRGVGRHAAARGLGAVALRVLEGGSMLGREDAGAAHAGAAQVGAAHAIRAALADGGADPAQGAIRFVLSNSDVSTALIGFSNREQIQSAARASELGRLPEAMLHLIEGLS